MTTHPTVAELVDTIERRYPPRWAADGDAIGLVVGDPDANAWPVMTSSRPTRADVSRR